MKRTQVQIPDWLFAAAHELAEAREISLAELVRRGLEYIVAATPAAEPDAQGWELPAPRDLQSRPPFKTEDWRAQIHMERLKVAEAHGAYSTRKPC